MNFSKNELENTFIYFDPPYLRSETLYFDSFDYNSFYLWLEGLNQLGVKWMVSFDSGVKEMKELCKQEIVIKSQYSSYSSLSKKQDSTFQDSIYLNY